MRWRTVLVLVTVYALLPITSARAAGCGEYEGVGFGCRLPNGLLRMADGSTTHGPDYLTAQDYVEDAEPRVLNDEPAVTGTDTACASSSTDYLMQVIYAHPTGTDLFATRLEPIRDLVRKSQTRLSTTASLMGGERYYRTVCASGLIDVLNVPLSTPTATNFSDVVTALRSAGHTSTKRKYWVWYEGSGGAGVGGTGHLYSDDSPGVTNASNGNTSMSVVAVSWGHAVSSAGSFFTRVWMHENGHNMGAVQDGAPDSNSIGHCNDGKDIMCYDETSSSGHTGTWSPSTCATEYFDCDNDTYFHLAPASGSYLATKWNIGSTVNRFLSTANPNRVSFTSATASGTEGTTISISATLQRAASSPVTAPLTITYGSATSADLSSPPATMTFATGSATTTTSFTTFDDALPEPSETFSVGLGSLPSDFTAGTPASVAVTISDNDPPVLSLGAASVTQSEVTPVSVILSRSASNGASSTASYAFSPGGPSGTATISPAALSTTISASFDDTIYQGASRSLTLTISSPVNGTLGSPSTTSITLTDNETPPVISLATTSTTVKEGSDATVTFTRTGATGNAVSVVATPIAGSATAADFVGTPKILSFAAGATSAVTTFSTVADFIAESAESFTVELSSPSSPALLGSPTSAAITIEPSDQQPDLTIAGSAGPVGDGAYGAGQSVTRGGLPLSPSVFTITVQNDGTAASQPMTVTGTSAGMYASIVYKSGSTNVTSLMTGAGLTLSVTPGSPVVLTAEVTPYLPLSVLEPTFTVTGRWTGDVTLTDAVSGRVTLVV